jgi:phytoene/squalene synthetase
MSRSFSKSCEAAPEKAAAPVSSFLLRLRRCGRVTDGVEIGFYPI